MVDQADDPAVPAEDRNDAMREPERQNRQGAPGCRPL
jgi:hypothetical protein